MKLPRIAVDLSALRASRDLRLLVLGNWVTGLGTQAALVALPFQIYEQTRSAFLTGLLGAVELVPLVTFALVGGAFADRFDRRRLLLLDQIALILCAAALALLIWRHGDPPLAGLYVLGGLLAGFGAVQNVGRSAIVPNLVDPAHLRSALAVNFGLFQLTLVVGPAVGGVLIGLLGTGAVLAIDAVSCLAMVAALIPMAPQPPQSSGERPPVRRSIAEGLRFVRTKEALMGSFAIDLVAMTFGMPRALFPVLAVSVYHAGPEGTGLLFASVSAGATVAALTTAWLERARRLGLIVLWAVIVWGVAIALAGLAGTIVVAALLLAAAGAADSVSAVCRSTINQSVTPDALRGRMSSVFSLVVTSGPRLGDVESGAVAALAGVRFSVVSGGLACIAGAVAVVAAFPALIRYDAEREIAAMRSG
jgi:predicted MFS family arabinose efflux permease